MVRRLLTTRFINNPGFVRIRIVEVFNMALIVKANIKGVVPGYNVAGDFAVALEKMVDEAIKKAASRAEANGRKTIMAKCRN